MFNSDTLRAVIDRILPADKDPGGLEAGADAYVMRLLEGSPDLEATVAEGLRGLEAASLDLYGRPFAALPAGTRDALIAAVEHMDWFGELALLAGEGFYADPDNGGNRDAVSWRMIGYEHGLPEGPNGPPPQPPKLTAILPDDGIAHDAIVVGAGAGGIVAASVMALAGLRVLLVERGAERSYADSGHRDHLRNHRLFKYGINTGPDIEGNPRVLVGADGSERVLAPYQTGYNLNAAAVGSGTLVYGGMAMRFLPEDFRMASLYGVPEDSSMVDWPIGYDDLAPWYGKVEWEVGVSGEIGVASGDANRGYPMPPLPGNGQSRRLGQGAARLGLNTFKPPMLINSVPRDGRPACIKCASCSGFPCPSDAKNGTQNTLLPRALETGRLTLVSGAMVERIETDPAGRVTGVSYRAAGADDGGRRHTVRAGRVVVAAGAIETARLLLVSRSERHPEGLGNAHDQVGRHLQGHYYTSAWGLFEDEAFDMEGPGVTIGTLSHCHGNRGIVGGGLLANNYIQLPVVQWLAGWPDEVSRWGRAPKDFMRDNFRRIVQVSGPTNETPSPESRVRLDPRVRDKWGLPVARLSGLMHPESVRTANFILEKSEEWLAASGASRVWSAPVARRLSAGQHQAGTCRMGTDPETSVTDPWGRVWGHDNLFVADSSLHPTNGGMNPVLTIMANAWRIAARIASQEC